MSKTSYSNYSKFILWGNMKIPIRSFKSYFFQKHICKNKYYGWELVNICLLSQCLDLINCYVIKDYAQEKIQI